MSDPIWITLAHPPKNRRSGEALVQSLSNPVLSP